MFQINVLRDIIGQGYNGTNILKTFMNSFRRGGFIGSAYRGGQRNIYLKRPPKLPR